MHEDRWRFACSDCSRRFTTNGILQRHEARMHGLIAKFSCAHCQRKFTREEQLAEHHKSMHKELNAGQQRRLRKRLGIKVEQKPKIDKEKVSCSECGKIVMSKNLTKHIHAVHKRLGKPRKHTNKPKQCDECGKMLCGTNAHSTHMATVHSQARPYVCSESVNCQAKYATESLLRKHLRHRHCKCPACGYKALNRLQLKTHKCLNGRLIEGGIVEEARKGTNVEDTKRISIEKTMLREVAEELVGILVATVKRPTKEAKTSSYRLAMTSPALQLTLSTKALEERNKLEMNETSATVTTMLSISEEIEEVWQMSPTLVVRVCLQCDYGVNDANALQAHVRRAHMRKRVL